MSSLLALLAPSALAGEWHADAALRTDLPVSLGLSGTVEAPFRIRGTLMVGTFPGPYLDLVNAVATGAGWYDEPTAALIDAALGSALIVHPQIGVRPLPRLGLHFDVGWQLAALGGSLAPAEALGAVAGVEIPAAQELVEVEAAATVHMLTIQAGWEFVVAERVVLGVSLGGAFTVGSRTRITVPEVSGLPGWFGDPVGSALDAAAAEGEALLDETFQRYVHTPTIGLSAGYRFR